MVFFYTVALFITENIAPLRLKPNLNYALGLPGHLYSRLSEVQDRRDVDILFLGSSHTYRGFDTRIFSKHGYDTFNLGSSGQTPIQTRLLLNRHLEHLNPEMVIYEVYPENFMIDGVESSLDIIANGKNDKHILKMVIEINNIKTYNTYLYGLLYRFLNLDKSFTEPYIKGKDTYIPGGYVERRLEYYDPVPLEQKRISINESQLEHFSEIVATLKDNNIEVVLVYAPIPSSNYNRYINNDYYDKIMKTYSTYYNFNEIMSLNDSLHFYDSDHLNQKGVELFNSELLDILEK